MALIVSQHFRWPFFVIFQKFLNFPLISEKDQKKIINLQVDANFQFETYAWLSGLLSWLRHPSRV